MSIQQNRRKADISISSSGDSTTIPAPGDGKYLAIDHINFVTAGAVTVQFKTGSTNYGGAYPLTTNQAVTLENAYQGEDGIITCGNNEAFVINLGGAVQVSGFVRYRVVGE
jgi:hypothetical protein